VLEAVDGRDALEMLQAHQEVRLLLSDVRMPGIDGLQLVAEVRRLRPEIKVLLMTGYSSQLASRPGRPPGVYGVLTKPFSMAFLAREVHRTLLSLAPESEQQESP
jgi:CheY-like chemotaxis protein